jgi:hypothetical protein
LSEPPVRRIRWARTFRIVASRYPPIQLFERIADPDEWETLAEIEGLTNDRIRQEIGDISIVPPGERVSGPGASFVMAAFTHLGRPSRFSDGAWGVYYCARERGTAVRETLFHMGRFYAATREPALDVDMRVLVGRIDAPLHDIRGGLPRWRALHDPDDYAPSQAFARRLRRAGSNGVAYDSVRAENGQCIGAFRPRAVGIPVQSSHLTYHWNGERMDRWFDHESERWIPSLGG